MLTYCIYRASYLQESEAIQKFKLVQFSRDVKAHETQELIYFDSLHRGENEQDPRLRQLANMRINECKGIYGGNISMSGITDSTASAAPFLFYPNFYQVKTRSKISTAHIFNEFSKKQNDMWGYSRSDLRLQKNDTGCQAALGQPSMSVQRASFASDIGRFRLLIILLGVLLIAGGYSMIKQIVMELFILRTPEKYQFQSTIFRENFKSFKKLMNAGKHLFIVTVPVQFKELVKHLKEENEDYKLAYRDDICKGGFSINKKLPDDKKKPFLVLNFDLVGNEGEVNGMEALEDAMRTTNVILVSNFDPLDLLHRLLVQQDEKGAENSNLEHDKLTDLLAEFET
ncbi:MAG: hypothetical protein U5K69_28130 [Balneolaceae bacterium]|nr:hypothetical protein [Balneolaceae bacterium]